MNKNEISKAMADLAKFKWQKVSKKNRIAHGKMMSDAAREKRSNHGLKTGVKVINTPPLA